MDAIPKIQSVFKGLRNGNFSWNPFNTVGAYRLQRIYTEVIRLLKPFLTRF